MTDDLVTVASKQLRPFWGRVTAIDSPVDEEQRDSGLIVPIGDVGGSVHRGVVAHIDKTYHEAEGQWSTYARQIDTGTVIYFKTATRLLDLWVVDIQDVIAYESDE